MVDFYKIFAIALPFQLILVWKYGFSLIAGLYLLAGVLGIKIWFEENKKKKIRKRHLNDIHNMIDWI